MSKLPQITVLLYPSFQMQVIFPVEVIHLHSRFADSILVSLDITVLVHCDETVYQFQFMRDSPFNNKTVRPVFFKSILILIKLRNHFCIPNYNHLYFGNIFLEYKSSIQALYIKQEGKRN